MPLFVDPATLPRWAAADAFVFLVGGYDGNANFGDVAQLLGALRAVEPCADLVAPVVVVEAELVREHARIASTWPDELGSRLVVAFAGPDEHVPDGLVPLPSVANAIGVALYLYGGGYANGLWGARKSAMADAVRDWMSGPWPELDGPAVLATGLQVDPSLRETAGGLDSWLSRAGLLTARDGASVRALSGVNVRAVLGPDDALGLIGRSGPGEAGSTSRTDRLRIGVHLNVEAYSTADAGRRRLLLAAAVASLRSRDTRPSEIVPIVAFEGRRVRESEAFAGLAPVLEAAGSAVAEPIDLSSAYDVSRLSGLDAVVACSYHVALASGGFGVPTWLMVDNEYYEQKLRGIEDQIGEGRVEALRDSASPDLEPVLVMGSVRERPHVPVDAGLVMLRADAARAEVGQALGLVVLGQWNRHVHELSAAYAEASVEAARLRSTVGDYVHAVEASAQREMRIYAENEYLSHHLQLIEQSRIWRASAPYRRLRNRLSRSGEDE